MATSHHQTALLKTYIYSYLGELALLNREGPAGLFGFQLIDQEGRSN